MLWIKTNMVATIRKNDSFANGFHRASSISSPAACGNEAKVRRNPSGPGVARCQACRRPSDEPFSKLMLDFPNSTAVSDRTWPLLPAHM